MCKCDNLQSTVKHHKHIVTGDLRIIEIIYLRKILSKGLKYRQKKEIDMCKARHCILSGIEYCAETFCNQYGVHKSALEEWEQKN